MLASTISPWDLFVVAIYLVAIFVMAFQSGKLKISNQKGNLIEQQYLAGKSLTFTESLCSIIATEVSALTFLGIPAFAYGQDYSFIQIYIGALFGRVLIAKLILPKIYDQGITIYSVMGKRGNENGQRATALFYFLNKILAVGVRLFSGSILIAEFFNTSIYVAVGLICFITFFYTMIGGLKAVVRTDMAQMTLFILGGLIAHYLIPKVGNATWSEYIMLAYQNGKTSFLDFNNPLPFIIGVVGGVLFDMATHGVDQDFAQRLTANRSIKTAKKAIILSTFLSIAVGFLFLSIGSLLWSYYQLHTPPMIANDGLFAHFITHHFPTGIKGLMVAGVLAATMSTLDSTINALSASFYTDILHHKTNNRIEMNKLYRRDTLVITVLLMIVAFIASKSDGLLLLGLKITSWTAGTLLALFFATLIWPTLTRVKLDAKAVLLAYVFGTAAVYINSNILQWNWNFNVYWGFFASTLILIIKGNFYDKYPKDL
jgi:solute:Na+ symporter, SSS family